MKQGVWSHVCGVIRIAVRKRYKDNKNMGNYVKHIIQSGPSIGGDNGTEASVWFTEEPLDKLIKVGRDEDYRVVITIFGDLENVTKEETRKMYDEFIRYLMTECRIIQKSSTIIDNDREKRRPKV